MGSLAREVAEFQSELDSARLALSDAEGESRQTLERTFATFNEISKVQLGQLRSDLGRLASRVGELCSVLEGEPVGPLEEAIRRSRVPEEILPFLASNDIEQFVLPAKHPKAVVLLDFLVLLGELLNQEIAYSWFERSLLDLDTQDRAIRQRAPKVLAVLSEKVGRVPGSKGHLLDHLIRSLAVEYRK
jgi:hypothetical protein